MKLSFNLYGYDSTFWSRVINIDDLVDFKKNLVILHTKDSTKKKKFLYEQLKATIENQPLKQQIPKKRIGLLFNMIYIKHKIFGNNPKVSAEITTWLQSVERSLKMMIYDSALSLQSSITDILQLISKITQRTDLPGPILDLSDYLLEDDKESINAEKFVQDFSRQFTINYDLWEGLHIIVIRQDLISFSRSVIQLLKHGANFIFSQCLVEHLDFTYRCVLQLKEMVSNLLEYLEQHHNFCESLLEMIHMEYYTSRSVNIANYIYPYKEYLNEVFDSGKKPELPLVVPHIMDMKKQDHTINTEREYNAFRTYYLEVKSVIQKMEAMMPTKWPQSLPNLSTHNGKPRLIIKDKNSYSLILGSYSQYLKRISTLKNEFTLCIRSFYKFLDIFKQFHDPMRKLSHLYGSEKLSIILNINNSINTSRRSKEKPMRTQIQLVKRPRITNDLQKLVKRTDSLNDLLATRDPKDDIIYENMDPLNRKLSETHGNNEMPRSISAPNLRSNSSSTMPVELNTQMLRSHASFSLVDSTEEILNQKRAYTICANEFYSLTEESTEDQ